MLLEVPGIDGKSGPDLENVRRLKALRGEVGDSAVRGRVEGAVLKAQHQEAKP